MTDRVCTTCLLTVPARQADTVMTSMRDNTLALRKKCPENTQALFFSATFPETVAKFAESVVKEPYTVVRLKARRLPPLTRARHCPRSLLLSVFSPRM